MPALRSSRATAWTSAIDSTRNKNGAGPAHRAHAACHARLAQHVAKVAVVVLHVRITGQHEVALRNFSAPRKSLS
jgi:hypothetical protein